VGFKRVQIKKILRDFIDLIEIFLGLFLSSPCPLQRGIKNKRDRDYTCQVFSKLYYKPDRCFTQKNIFINNVRTYI
jgi:hypothetical protein